MFLRPCVPVSGVASDSTLPNFFTIRTLKISAIESDGNRGTWKGGAAIVDVDLYIRTFPVLNAQELRGVSERRRRFK